MLPSLSNGGDLWRRVHRAVGTTFCARALSLIFLLYSVALSWHCLWHILLSILGKSPVAGTKGLYGNDRERERWRCGQEKLASFCVGESRCAIDVAPSLTLGTV